MQEMISLNLACSCQNWDYSSINVYGKTGLGSTFCQIEFCDLVTLAYLRNTFSLMSCFQNDKDPSLLSQIWGWIVFCLLVLLTGIWGRGDGRAWTGSVYRWESLPEELTTTPPPRERWSPLQYQQVAAKISGFCFFSAWTAHVCILVTYLCTICTSAKIHSFIDCCQLILLTFMRAFLLQVTW